MSSHNWAVFNRWFAITTLDLMQEGRSLRPLNLLTAALSFPRGLTQARLCPSGDRLILTAAWRERRGSQSPRQMLGPDPSPTRAEIRGGDPFQVRGWRPRMLVQTHVEKPSRNAFKFYVTGTFFSSHLYLRNFSRSSKGNSPSPAAPRLRLMSFCRQIRGTSVSQLGFSYDSGSRKEHKDPKY